jgi:Zn-dependent peptidase ImmA (M78 family)
MEVEGDDKFCEQAAQRFAGAFLMPAEALWSHVGRHRRAIGWSELFALQEVFGASMQAITSRCSDLGIFPPPLSQRLLREFARLGYRSAPHEVERSQGVSRCASLGWPLRRNTRYSS